MVLRRLLLATALTLLAGSGACADGGAALEDCRAAAHRAWKKLEFQQAIATCTLAERLAKTPADKTMATNLIDRLRSAMVTIKPKPRSLDDRMVINPLRGRLDFRNHRLDDGMIINQVPEQPGVGFP